MRWFACSLGVWAVTVFVVSMTPHAQAPSPALTGEYRPPPPPVQPIDYSHKTHIEAGLTCVDCHATATTADQATLPPTSTCMSCHVKTRPDSVQIQKLAAFSAKGEVVPWRRVYRLPDYVYFSHSGHLGSDRKLTCQTCHGDVAMMDVMQKVKDISMAACIACHKEYSAPTLCDSCHEKM